jgi:hypothetical protein
LLNAKRCPREEAMPTKRQYIQAKATARAEELAVAQGHRGPGKFSLKHYELALSELSPEEREAERGGATRQPTYSGDPDSMEQAQGAARHIDQQAASFLRQARRSNQKLSYSGAVKRAIAQSPQIAARAGVAPELKPGHEPEGAKHYKLMAGVRGERKA